jgi:hypothetical protein
VIAASPRVTPQMKRVTKALDGRLYLLFEPRPAKFERVDTTGLNEAGYGEEDFA